MSKEEISSYRQVFKEIKEIAFRLRTKTDYRSTIEVDEDIDKILQKCDDWRRRNE